MKKKRVVLVVRIDTVVLAQEEWNANALFFITVVLMPVR